MKITLTRESLGIAWGNARDRHVICYLTVKKRRAKNSKSVLIEITPQCGQGCLTAKMENDIAINDADFYNYSIRNFIG